MAAQSPDHPHQNSDSVPVVVHPARSGSQGEGRRFLFVFLMCYLLSGAFHVVICTLFLFVTVNTGAATTTEVKTIETLIDDEKPKDANLTNPEEGGLDPDQL